MNTQPHIFNPQLGIIVTGFDQDRKRKLTFDTTNNFFEYIGRKVKVLDPNKEEGHAVYQRVKDFIATNLNSLNSEINFQLIEKLEENIGIQAAVLSSKTHGIKYVLSYLLHLFNQRAFQASQIAVKEEISDLLDLKNFINDQKANISSANPVVHSTNIGNPSAPLPPSTPITKTPSSSTGGQRLQFNVTPEVLRGQKLSGNITPSSSWQENKHDVTNHQLKKGKENLGTQTSKVKQREVTFQDKCDFFKDKELDFYVQHAQRLKQNYSKAKGANSTLFNKLSTLADEIATFNERLDVEQNAQTIKEFGDQRSQKQREREDLVKIDNENTEACQFLVGQDQSNLFKAKWKGEAIRYATEEFMRKYPATPSEEFDRIIQIYAN